MAELDVIKGRSDIFSQRYCTDVDKDEAPLMILGRAWCFDEGEIYTSALILRLSCSLFLSMGFY